MTSLGRFNDWYSKHWQRFDYDEALEVWKEAERQALERALDAGMNAAFDDMPNQAAFDTWCRVRNAIRALTDSPS